MQEKTAGQLKCAIMSNCAWEPGDKHTLVRWSKYLGYTHWMKNNGMLSVPKITRAVTRETGAATVYVEWQIYQ